MTPTAARKLENAIALLGHPHDGVVIAAARTISQSLAAAGMDWNSVAMLVSAEATRRPGRAFTFATTPPRRARKLMAHLARQPVATPACRKRLEQLRVRLLGSDKLALADDEIAWLDGLWRAANGSAPPVASVAPADESQHHEAPVPGVAAE